MTRKVTIRLEEDEWRALRRLAEMESRSMNQQIKRLILVDAAKKGVYQPTRPTVVQMQS